MKFEGFVDINCPRERVVSLFMDPGNLSEFQDGFVKKVLLSGTAGEPGATSEMHYKYGNREMLLIETIVANHLPDSFEAHYHHKHMDNTMKCTFSEVGDGLTRYHYAFEYTRINWLMPKLISILFPSMYRKQGEKWMRQFKEFAERQ